MTHSSKGSGWDRTKKGGLAEHSRDSQCPGWNKFKIGVSGTGEEEEEEEEEDTKEKEKKKREKEMSGP